MANKEKKVVDGEDNEDQLSVIVLKVDIHCKDCALKIKRCIKKIKGVEGVMVDQASKRLKVLGNVDPWAIRERVETKVHRNVEFVSPENPPKREEDGGGKKKATAGAASAREQAISEEVSLDCDGCVQRARRFLLKCKSVAAMSVPTAAVSAPSEVETNCRDYYGSYEHDQGSYDNESYEYNANTIQDPHPDVDENPNTFTVL